MANDEEYGRILVVEVAKYEWDNGSVTEGIAIGVLVLHPGRKEAHIEFRS